MSLLLSHYLALYRYAVFGGGFIFGIQSIMNRRDFTLKAGAAIAALALHPMRGVAATTDLPDIINLIVPFVAGGGTDLLGRDFAQTTAQAFARSTIVVENKPGANGAIAARYVSKQKADGSSILLGSSSTQALGPLIMPSDVDPIHDLTPVTLLAETANALAVGADSPYQTLDQYIQAATKQKMTFGTFGAGSSGHLYGMVLAGATGAQLMHVPYKGSAQAINDLLGGHVESVFLTTSALDSFSKNKKVRILAVTGARRTGIFPDVPTFEELGIKSLDFNGWFALFAPKGTSPALVEDLAERSRSVITNAAFGQRMKRQGYDWVGSSPAELTAALAKSIEIYKAILAKYPIGV